MSSSSPIPGLEPYTTVGHTQVYRTSDQSVVAWKSGLNIDADGSPHAYSPDGSPPGLDYLANAGSPGNWWGIVTESGQSNGTPVIQGSSDPAPGFYVSSTALVDSSYNFKSPLAYVDSETIPFIVLPGSHSDFGGSMGDLCTVVRLSTNQFCHAIAADIGPSDQIGEGSIALANALGINSSPKNGGTSSGIGFVFYPGSGDGKPKTVEQINAIAQPLFEEAVSPSVLAGLSSAPEVTEPASTTTTSTPPEPLIAYGTTSSDDGKALQTFLNQYPGIQVDEDGVPGRTTSDALYRVAGIYLSGDPSPGSVQGNSYIVYDSSNRTDYAAMLESYLSGFSGVSVDADGYSGQSTSDALHQVFGSYLSGDPRGGGTGIPLIPCDSSHFSAYAGKLQEFLAGLPGISIQTDGYAGANTSDALFAATGARLYGDDSH